MKIDAGEHASAAFSVPHSFPALQTRGERGLNLAGPGDVTGDKGSF